jgi:hypothetical protein
MKPLTPSSEPRPVEGLCHRDDPGCRDIQVRRGSVLDSLSQ